MGRFASVYFSPDRGADEVVIGFIDGCSTRLDIAVYSLTHDGIADAIIRAQGRGVPVRVLMDKTQAGSRYADDERLEAEGVDVRRDRIKGVMHHKFIIGDGRTPGSRAVLTGSYNFTLNATNKNQENFVVLRLSYVAKAYQQEFDSLWARHSPED